MTTLVCRGVDSPSVLVPPLRDVRRSRQLSLRSAAMQAGIDPAHLSRVERGTKSLSIDALYRLARVLELAEVVAALEPYATAGRRQ